MEPPRRRDGGEGLTGKREGEFESIKGGISDFWMNIRNKEFDYGVEILCFQFVRMEGADAEERLGSIWRSGASLC